jgi:DNA-binding MarR family transcriptional regulator
MNQPGAFALEEFVPYRLSRLAEIIGRDFSAIYRNKFGMTRPEWRSFAIIGQCTETTATEIARQSAMHKTKVSRAIAALETRRLVERSVSGADRRVEILRLTRQGQDLFDALRREVRDYEAMLKARFGEESMRKLCETIRLIEGIAGVS